MPIDFSLTEEQQQIQDAVRAFVDERVLPVAVRNDMEHKLDMSLIDGMRDLGILGAPIPTEWGGAGLDFISEALICEEIERGEAALRTLISVHVGLNSLSLLGNANDEQKERWLKPLLDGTMRSVFCMTEPDVASSDATNMQATATVEGDEVVLNGKKWWSSGIGDPRAKVCIFMALTKDDTRTRHEQHSMVVCPLDAPGVKIVRMLPVFGHYDEPHGHGEVHFDNVRLPVSSFIAGPGRGFEIAQGRLGPGRIHHCMRAIGAAETALELMVKRAMSRVAFNKPIMNLGGNRERLADARIAIDQARLLTLYAAWKVDKLGAIGALTEISAIKVIAPNMLQKIADDAIQIHGGAGVSNDTALAAIFIIARCLRLADGPDEVHKGLIARVELMRLGYSR